MLSQLTHKLTQHKKWSFLLRISSVNVTRSANLVTFTEEIFNGKLYFLCSVSSIYIRDVYSIFCYTSKMNASFQTFYRVLNTLMHKSVIWTSYECHMSVLRTFNLGRVSILLVLLVIYFFPVIFSRKDNFLILKVL